MYFLFLLGFITVPLAHHSPISTWSRAIMEEQQKGQTQSHQVKNFEQRIVQLENVMENMSTQMKQLMELLQAQVNEAAHSTPPLAQVSAPAPTSTIEPIPIQTSPPIQDLLNLTPQTPQMTNPIHTQVAEEAYPTLATIQFSSNEEIE